MLVIDIAPLTVLFVIARSLICNCPLLKDISFKTKCLLVQAIFWINHTFVVFKHFEIVPVLLGQFQNFQKGARAIYPKSASKHVITTNYIYHIAVSYGSVIISQSQARYGIINCAGCLSGPQKQKLQ